MELGRVRESEKSPGRGNSWAVIAPRGGAAPVGPVRSPRLRVLPLRCHVMGPRATDFPLQDLIVPALQACCTRLS